MGYLKIMENIDLQKESCLEAVDKNMVGKGILFPLQLPRGCLSFAKKFATV